MKTPINNLELFAVVIIVLCLTSKSHAATDTLTFSTAINSPTLTIQGKTALGTNASPETYGTNYHSFSLPGNSVAWSLVGDSGGGSNYVNVPMFGNSGWTNSSNIKAATLHVTGISTVSGGVASLKNNTAAPTAITVGASVFNYTNTQLVNIQVFLDANGATTAVTFNGTAVFGSLVAGDHTIIMQPGDRIGVTYSVATPVMNYREF